MASISIETNRKEIEVMRDGEKVGSIYFDASDQGILARLYAVCDQAKHIQLKKTDNADELFADYRRIETELRAAVDEAFDCPCCDIVFGTASCFATANGVSQLGRRAPAEREGAQFLNRWAVFPSGKITRAIVKPHHAYDVSVENVFRPWRVTLKSA